MMRDEGLKLCYYKSMHPFEKFLQVNPIVISTVQPLKENACILIQTPEQKYYFKKVNNTPVIEKEFDGETDLIFKGSLETLNKLFENESLTIGEYGVKIIEAILRKEVNVKINIGPIKFFSKGYLGVLSLGGKDFLAFLKNKGVSLTDIGKILKGFK